MENYVLNNGVLMPKVGLGVYQMKNQHEDAIVWALRNGYRHIDTAAFYHNEELVASAIQKSGVDRKDIFITTKLWNSDHGKKTKQAFETSLKKLKTDYLDLYLIHWPSPKYIESWEVMEQLYKEGKVRAIGVSNFERNHLEDVLKHGTIVPAVDQIHTNVFLQQEELHQYLVKNQIQHVAWGPFGHGNQQLFNHPVLKEIAEKYGKTTAQVMLRWNLERGISVIPKSINPERLKANLDIVDFRLSQEEMRRISSLDTNKRGFVNPNNKLMLWVTQFIR
ncbi:aldo/keto reductase [Paenibacillus planticolens]|uniref:Aldo/keto reductase n=1 Tax=Paenibacillus planticolens TaxID=2654976 RepID=A0ABX1ZFR1_9BACL|nr:aldo/keto reductase [Paenibacillus planticolens]NOU98933.1 aldo/keto reductase [Paenibacillus planticolens]